MGEKEKENYVYIVRCNDHTLYSGWTNDLEHRIKSHNQGKGAKYTRGRLPVTLVYFECYESKEEAMRREYKIKKMKRESKTALIEQGKIKENMK